MYSSHVKNLKTAEYVAAGLDGLEGEELLRQHRRLQELLATANRQQEERQWQQEEQVTASGTETNRPSAGTIVAGRPRAMQQASYSHGDQQREKSRSGSTRSGHPKQPRALGAPTGQPRQLARPAGAPAGRQPARGSRQPARSAVSLRLGPRILPAGNLDARSRLDLLAESRTLEEEDAPGPLCFWPRIQQEPFPKGFSLPRDTPKYKGTTKPKN
jgi:hypothetical protein